MSASIRSNMGVFVASLIEGEGLQPKQLPRPVVKTTTLAPPATIPVTLAGSYPGVSMMTNPDAVTCSAYSLTCSSVEGPPFATAPRDFSVIVVKPPALLPTEGLLSISAPKTPTYHFHHSIRSSSLSATSIVRARLVNRCSAP